MGVFCFFLKPSETASENGPVEEVVEETRFLEVPALSVTNPCEAFARVSTANEFVRIRGRNPEERIDRRTIDGSSESGDELVENEASHRLLSENDLNFNGVVLDSSSKKSQAPIARISSDVDSLESDEYQEEEEDAPSHLRVNCAPKVRTWDSDADSNESETEVVVRTDFDTENNTVSLDVKETSLEHNQDSINVLEEVPESDTNDDFGEYEELVKHTVSPDLIPQPALTEILESVEEHDGILRDPCSVLDQETINEAENRQLLPSVETFTFSFFNNERNQASFAVLGEETELYDLLDEVMESVTSSVLEADKFSPNGLFADPGSMILETRIIADAMNPKLLDVRSTSSSFPNDHASSKVLQWLKFTEPRPVFEGSCFDSDNIEPGESSSILVIGKNGVRKSATINLILGDNKTGVDAFKPATDHVLVLTSLSNGVKLRIFDTPGLRNFVFNQTFNRKVQSSIRNSIALSKPDIVLYVDRLDMPTNCLDDLILMRLITSYLDGSNHTLPVCLVENNISKDERLKDMVPHWRSELLNFCYITKTPNMALFGSEPSRDHKEMRHLSGSDSRYDDIIHELKPPLKLRTDKENSQEPDHNVKRKIGRFGFRFQIRFCVGKLPMINIYTALDESHFSVKIRSFDQLQFAAMAMASSLAKFTLNKILSQPNKD